MKSPESRMSIAMDIEEAIHCAMAAASGRNRTSGSPADYRYRLTEKERIDEFHHCKALLHRVIRKLGLEKEWSELGNELIDIK